MICVCAYVDFTDICGIVKTLIVFINLKLLDAQHVETLFMSMILNVIVTTAGETSPADWKSH